MKKGQAVMSSALMDISKLSKTYTLRGGFFSAKGRSVHAVDAVDLQIAAGETLGLVGESGCGKSTLAKLLMRLESPEAGSARYKDSNIFELSGYDLKAYRRHVQMIFQDQYSSLNPRMSAQSIVAEPLHIHGIGSSKENIAVADELMAKVGLSKEQAGRYPHEFSGGQRQRIGIARALALQPELIIADEPVSALDASIQAQILNLLMDLKNDFGLTYLFVSHDLNVIRHVSDRIAVMYLGRIVELADRNDLYATPLHPYTRMLLSAMPTLTPGRKKRESLIHGEAGYADGKGCNFKNRCAHKISLCDDVQPILKEYSEKRWCACHRTGEI